MISYIVYILDVFSFLKVISIQQTLKNKQSSAPRPRNETY